MPRPSGRRPRQFTAPESGTQGVHPAVIAGMLVNVMSFTTAMPDEHVAERLKELFDEYLSLTMKLLEQRRAKVPAEELKRMDDMRRATWDDVERFRRSLEQRVAG